MIAKAIQRNRQRWKARRLIHKIRLKWFEYEDCGKLNKAKRVINKLARLIKDG